MSEAAQQQTEYHDEASSVDQQIKAQLAAAQADANNSSITPQSHKRKRNPAEEDAETEEGRAGTGTEGSTSSRRTSVKQTSPNMSAFLPINTSTQQSAQYAYQPLNVAQQHSPNAMNGSSAALDAATHAAIAANAMHLNLPSLAGVNTTLQYDAGKPVDPQPIEGQGHTEGVGGNVVQNSPPPRPVQQHSTPTPNPKPQVGTEEWHRVRRDNHKEVERRRRETINEGINELAKIVPGCEKNKGSILQRAVQYIQQLKENETQNIEKWTLEKLLTEQAIAQLSQANEKLQKEVERAWREAETWKKSCLQSGAKRESGSQDAGASS
ncbi:hypothetical protein BZA77DRAFT_67071 [Pyronema omphalodes]|nr:hypothetical protein BZA77DRAFT_67071 [Pyronema omphalodes]